MWISHYILAHADPPSDHGSTWHSIRPASEGRARIQENKRLPTRDKKILLARTRIVREKGKRVKQTCAAHSHTNTNTKKGMEAGTVLYSTAAKPDRSVHRAWKVRSTTTVQIAPSKKISLFRRVLIFIFLILCGAANFILPRHLKRAHFFHTF